MSFGIGILDAEVLELFSVTVDAGDGDGVAQVVEPSFQLADLALRGGQLLLEPGLARLSGSPRDARSAGRRRLRRRALPVVPLVLVRLVWTSDGPHRCSSRGRDERTIGDVPNPGRDPVDEEPVVRNKDDRPVIGGEHLLKRFSRLDIEMVGWLVENQQVRALDEKARKGQPRSFPPESAETARCTSSPRKRNRARYVLAASSLIGCDETRIESGDPSTGRPS